MAADNPPLIGITVDLDEDENGKTSLFSLKTSYADAVRQFGGVPVLLPVTCSPDMYFGRLDAILIPGGGDLPARAYGEKEKFPEKKMRISEKRVEFEMGLVRRAWLEKKPLLAICYGMQMVNVALGGSLYQDLEGASPNEPGKPGPGVNHKAPHQVIVEGGINFLPEGRFDVVSAHHQGVKKTAPGLCTIAFSDDGLVEAIRQKEHPFFVGVQWHPERALDSPLSAAIFGSFIRAAYENRA